MSHRPVFLHTAWQVLGAQFFGTIALRQFVLKNPCQQPRQRSYHPVFAHCLTNLGHTVFRHIRRDVNLSWKPVRPAMPSHYNASSKHPQFLGTITFMEFVLKTRCQKLCILVSLSPCASLLQLFPRLGPRVFQDNRNDNICPEKRPNSSDKAATAALHWALPKPFPRLECCLVPCQRSSPQAIYTVSCPSSMLSRSLPAKLSAISTISSPSSMLSRSLPAKLSANHLHGFLSFQHAVSRSLPAKLSTSYFHGFQSIQHAVSLPPSEAFRNLFDTFLSIQHACLAPSQRSSPQAVCTVSSPSSMLFRFLAAKPSPSYLQEFLSVQHDHAVSLPPSEALPQLFPRFPVRPACCLASSQRTFPQAICTVSNPSSMLSRFLPVKLSASYFHGFLFVQHAVSLPPSEALRKLFARFPVRPACCLAPSQRNSPQAISTVSSPSSMLSRSLPAKLSATYLTLSSPFSMLVSLPPSEAHPKLFARFPLRPACCFASSQRSFPQAICTVSCPSSMLSRSLLATLSASYLFARFPLLPACCPASSQRSSPQTISTVSSLPPGEALASYFHGFLSVQLLPAKLSYFHRFLPSSMLSRSLRAKLAASYFHGFLSVQHAVSLPPSETLSKLFARFPLRPACCLALPSEASPKLFPRFPVRPARRLAPSQRSSPQAMWKNSCRSSMIMLSRSLPAKLSPSYFHGSCPSSMLSRSLPAKLAPNYCHGFLSVQHAVSLLLSERFLKLFARIPVRPACCLAPSQRTFPQAIYTVSSPSSMLSRSLRAKLAASYFHGFLSVQHAVSLPPSETLSKLFARFPLRPACCLALPSEASPKLFPRFPVRPARRLAPSQRSSPQAMWKNSCRSSMIMLSRSLPAKLSPSYFHGSCPSSMLSRSLPAKLAPNYCHGFLSVQHAVSLLLSERFLKLFARIPVRPACCLAPSQRTFPQAIYTVSSPSSMLSRSLRAKLAASYCYLHGFLIVQHAVSLPPGETLPKLFPRFPVRPACCLAPSRQSSPQAISTVSFPSSRLCRSSHWSSPQAISTISSPSSMLSRSVQAKLSPSYVEEFLSVQHDHAVSLPPSEALPKLFPRFPVRPACCLAPSQRSSPQAICTVSSSSSMLLCSLPA